MFLKGISCANSPSITASGATTLCNNSAVILTSNLSNNVVWSNGSNSQSITVNNSGEFFTVYSDNTGCVDTSNYINVLANPQNPITLTTTNNYTPLQPYSLNFILPDEVTSLNFGYTVDFGPSLYRQVDAPLEWAFDSNGDSTLCNPASIDLTGKVALIRGECFFSLQAYYAQQAGAIAAIIVHKFPDNQGGGLLNMVGADSATAVIIPVLFISYDDAIPIINILDEGRLINTSIVPLSSNLGLCSSDIVKLGVSGGSNYLWSDNNTTQTITTSLDSALYTVEVTSLNGCIIDDTLTNSQASVFNPIISKDTTIYAGNCVHLTVLGASNHLWSNGSNFSFINVCPTTTTTYTVTASNNNGCSVTKDITVTVIPYSSVTITPSKTPTICIGDTITLTANQDSFITWSTGDTSQSIIVSESGTYTVTYHDTINSLPLSTASITVTVKDDSIYSSQGNQICLGDSITLEAINTTNATWSTGETTSSIVIKPQTSSLYTVNATTSFGCQYQDSIYINVNNRPIVSVSQDTSICQGTIVPLQAFGATFYNWYINNNLFTTGNPVNVNPSNTTNYQVVGIDNNGCRDTAEVEVEIVTSISIPTITANKSSTICIGDSITLTSSVPNNIIWSTGDTTPSIIVKDEGVYTVTVMIGSCSATSQSFEVYHDYNSINAIQTAICIGDTTTLSLTNATSILWSTGDTASTINVSPSSNTKYSVNFTAALGCQYQDTVEIIVNSLPNVTTSGDTSICPNSTVNLIAFGANQYIWNNTNIGQQISVTPQTQTVYEVVGTDANGCKDASSLTVYVNASIPIPTISSSNNNNTICPGDSIILTSDIINNIVWSTGETTPSIVVKNFGSYSVTHSSNNNCPSTTASTNIFTENATISTFQPIICIGDSTILNVSNAASVIWSTGSMASSIKVSPLVSTYYNANITTNSGCQYEDSLLISVSSLSNIVVNSDTTICEKAYTELSASSGASLYQWSNGAIGRNIQVSPDTTTTYTLTATNFNGCIENKNITVTVIPFPNEPTITLNGLDTICLGDSIQLTTNYTDYITWSTGETTPSIFVKDSTTYSVTYSDTTNSCPAVSNDTLIKIQENYIQTEDTVLCLGDTIQLNAINATNAQWSNGSTGNTISVFPNTTTSYVVSATTNLGCTYTDTMTISVHSSVPTPVMNLLPADSSLDMSFPIPFSWSPSLSATAYDILIWKDTASLSSQPLISLTDISQISYLYTPSPSNNKLQFGKTYKWMVIAKNDFCTTTPSVIQHFTMGSLPDVVVKNIQIPNVAYTGQSLTVTWEVQNIGGGDTKNAQWIDEVYISADTFVNALDHRLGNIANPSALNAGQSYSQTLTGVLPNDLIGNYYVLIKTNAYLNNSTLVENDVENNLSNSIIPLNIQLTPTPDLQVKSVVSPLTVFSGENTTVTWTVKNEGTGPTDITTNQWRDAIYISDQPTFDEVNATLLKSISFNSNQILDSDSSYTNTTDVTIPQGIFGDYYIYVKTDAYNNLFEFAHDGNNTLRGDTIEVKLTPPPNLIVDALIVPDTVSNNEAITVHWTVSNGGANSTGVSFWEDGIYISHLPYFDKDSSIYIGTNHRNGELYPTENYSLQKTVIVPTNINGDYYIYLVADVTDHVFEHIFEVDNIRRSNTLVYVKSPDFVPISISIPDTGYSSQPIQINWAVQNQSDATVYPPNYNETVISISSFSEFHKDSALILKKFNRDNLRLDPILGQGKSVN